jgi:flagellum-specific peptidoglycan hydrolase FlgJ
MAELSSLTVSLNDAFSAGATAVAQAADKMAAAFDKAAGSNTTVDTTLRTRGQTLDSVTNKIDGLAASTAKLEQIERTYEARVQVVTAGLQAQGASATQIADAITRLGVLRDQDAAKAVASGERTEQQFRKVADAALAAQQAMAQAQSAAAQAAKSAVISSPDFSFARDRGADIEAYGAELDRLRAKFNPLFAVSKQYEGLLNEIGNAERVGAISASEAAQARESATAAFSRSSSPITASTAALKGHTEATGNNRAMMRNLAIQATQTWSSLETGQPVMMTLVQQGHQVADSMLAQGQGFSALGSAAKAAWSAITSPIGLVVAGVAAVTGGLYELIKAGNTSLGMLASTQQAVRGNHADFETLGQTIIDVARKVSQSSGLGLDEALATAKALAQGRYFSGTATDLERLARDANDLGAAMGTSAAEGAKILAQGMEDPAKTAESLASTFSTKLTPELLRQIDLAQKAGDQNKAYTLLLGGLEAAAGGAARNGLSPIAKAWQDLGNAFTGSTQGWKPFTEWLARDFALAIQNVTTLVNTFKDAWNGIKSIPAVTQSLTSQGATNLAGALGTGDAAQLTSGQANLPSAQVAASLTSSATKDAFVQNWLAAATSAGQQLGVSPQVLLGQWGLETGFGRSAYNNNLGNIKPGSNYAGQTFINPGDQTAYRSYATPQAFADDFVRLLQTGRYSGALNTGSNALAYGQALQGGGYATDPNYAAKLAAAAGGIQLPGSMVATAKASADAVAEMVKQTRALKEEDLAQQLDDVHHKMDAVAASAGTSSEQYRGLQQVEAGIIKAQHDNVDEMTAAQRATESQLRATSGLTAGEQGLSAAIEARRQVALNAGLPFGDEQQQQATLNFLAQQSQEAERLAASIGLQAQQSTLLARAYTDGNQAVVDTTAKQQAYNEAIKLFPASAAQQGQAIAALAPLYRDLARAAGEAQVAQQNMQSRDSLDFIQAQTATLGLNEDARIRLLAVMKAEQAMHQKFGDILPKEAQDYISLAGATADATAAFQLQQNSLNELKGFFTNTFDTISNAITQAFATGNLAALKFKDIAKSVASAVISEFAKLAILNPLKNWLFGGNDVTLSSVGGVIGNLFGGGSAANDNPVSAVAGSVSAVGSVAALLGLGGSGSKSPFDQAGTTLTSTGELASSATAASSGGTLNAATAGLGLLTKLGSIKEIGQLLSGTYAGGSLGTIGDLLSTPIISNAAGPTLSGATLDATQGLASGSGLGIGGAGIGVTAGQALGAIGGLYGAYSGFQRGGVGGTVQGVAGLASAGLAVAGTGALGAGAAGLAAAAGPYAPIALAAIALLSAFLPGAHPLHPFQGTEVNVAGGQVAVGRTLAQIEDPTSALQATQQWVGAVNDYMAATKITLTNQEGRIGGVGEGIKGFNQTMNPNDLFSSLSFNNDPTKDVSNFGVAKGALFGMHFQNIDQLQGELVKIATFADSMSVVGIKLASVGQDLTNIKIGEVQAPEANDLRMALSKDLTGQTFANIDALQAEIDKVNQFVNGTIPGLLHPVEQTTSSIVDQANKIYATYQQAIDQSLQYGLDNTAALRTAEEQALAIVRRSGVEQIRANATLIQDRFFVASQGGAQRSANQTADNFDIQAQQQRDALSKLWTDTYGDAIKQTGDYLRAMNELETTLGAERVAVVKQVSQQIAAAFQGLSDTVQSYGARIMAATGNPQGAQLENLDIKAAQERNAFIKSFTDFFGDAIVADATFQAQLATVDAAHYAERLQMLQSFQTQQDAAYQNLSDTVEAMGARDFASKGDQKTADLINFDMRAAGTGRVRTVVREPLRPGDHGERDLPGAARDAGARAGPGAVADHREIRDRRDGHGGDGNGRPDQAGAGQRRHAVYEPVRLRAQAPDWRGQPAFADEAV